MVARPRHVPPSVWLQGKCYAAGFYGVLLSWRELWASDAWQDINLCINTHTQRYMCINILTHIKIHSASHIPVLLLMEVDCIQNTHYYRSANGQAENNTPAARQAANCSARRQRTNHLHIIRAMASISEHSVMFWEDTGFHTKVELTWSEVTSSFDGP